MRAQPDTYYLPYAPPRSGYGTPTDAQLKRAAGVFSKSIRTRRGWRRPLHRLCVLHVYGEDSRG